MPSCCRPERFGGGEATRDLLLDPVKTLPKWQRQLLSNSFGKERKDLDNGKVARQARIAELRAQLGSLPEMDEADGGNRAS